ncbi:isopeptide-forming domain-containing fimbrial protein, partial [Acaricomes phytoseiuli]|uniref:DUF7927 domain-containing protein n=1 Tax=Acaricomes phytoseiuli TaxID=291968 RepID=UPI0022213086
GQRVELVYSVTVNADVPAGVLVENRMTSTATPPTGEPIEPPEVVITHPTPGYEHSKTSDPAPGSSVQGGQKITYTVMGKNTGRTVLDPVVITDDMSQVLNNAAYNNDVVAELLDAQGNVVSTSQASLNGSTLSWSGSLQPGQSVRLVYSVTVNADVAAGTLLQNKVESKPDELPPPPPIVVEHKTPGYEHAKVSDPAPGTSVKGGQQIKYTVTGKNTGETRLDPVKITDDMSKV